MNAHLWHAVGIILLVSLAAGIYRWVSGRRGTPRLVSSATACVAAFWATWRWLFMHHTRFGPFRHLSGNYLVLVLVISGLVLVLARIGMRRGILRVLAVFALVLAVAAPFNWLHLSDRDYRAECAAQGKTVNIRGNGCDTTAQVTPTPSATPAKSAAQCPHGFNVAYDHNASNRVLSNGVNGTPDEIVNKVMAVAKHDSRVLTLYWNATPQGTAHPVADFRSLESNGCLNDHGMAIYYQTLGAYDSAVKSNSAAPSNGVNTGVTPNGSPFYEASGSIGGNRTAAKVQFKNGSVLYIMHRCGNIVTSKPIVHIPPKPRPHPECKPGMPVGSPGCKPPMRCYSPGNGPHPVGRPAPGQPICKGKDPSQGIANQPGVPPQTTGCGADGGNTYPCRGGTATNHPVQSAPPPASGSTQCGESGNAPCESPSPRPQPTPSPAPSGYPSPPPPGSGGNYPSHGPSSPPPASGDPGGGSG